MSEAFSGQTTRSGCGDAAGADVRGELAGGLDVVVEHRRALGVEAPGPAAARCPGRRATCTGSPAGRHGHERRAADRGHGGGDHAAPRRAAAGGAAASTAQASTPPSSATTKVTSGAPPSAASGVSALSPWLKASRPHGKPPNGSAVAQRLLQHPQRRRPQRPAGQAAARRAAARRAARGRPPAAAPSATRAPGPAMVAVHSTQRQEQRQPGVRPEQRAAPGGLRRGRRSASTATPAGASQRSADRREREVQQQPGERRRRRGAAAAPRARPARGRGGGPGTSGGAGASSCAGALSTRPVCPTGASLRGRPAARGPAVGPTAPGARRPFGPTRPGGWEPPGRRCLGSAGRRSAVDRDGGVLAHRPCVSTRP